MADLVKEPIVVKPVAVGLVSGAGVSELLVRKSRDVVLRYTVRVEEIYERGIENGLEEQLARVDAEIASIGTPVELPKDADDRLKVAIEQFNTALPDAVELQARKTELLALKTKVEAVK